MTIPTTGELRTQLLRILHDQSTHNLGEVRETIANRMNITETERKKMSKKGRPTYDLRMIQALSTLRKKGLIANEKRGVFKITKAGYNEAKKN